MKWSAEDLVAELSQVVDPRLARSAVESYLEMQQRFLIGDWKPTELDGGRLCEAIARCYLQLDLGIITQSEMPGSIRGKLLDKGIQHRLSQSDREHFAKALDLVYKFRSDRGAVHISPIHTANQMDSTLVVHVGKWMLAELLRIAWNQDRQLVGEIISQIVQLEHSLIHELEGKPLVLSTSFSTPEEVLFLLNHAPSNRLSRTEIRESASNRKASAVNMAITRLIQSREVRVTSNGEIALTPLGQRRVMEKSLS